MDFHNQRFSSLSGIGIKRSSNTMILPRSASPLPVRSNSHTTLQTQSQDYSLCTYGLPYPVQINEALTFGKNTGVSINCSNNGYAWAVSGRKLYIWQYKESKSIVTPQRRTLAGQCRVLTLPHCDIGNKANLVTVFVTDGHQSASCIASSPTGDIRFWQSINHDNASINQNGILEGQEFDQLIKLSSNTYLLSTTTCQLVLLQTNGQQAIQHRIIKSPQGFLGGIGKKFASIVGINSDHDKENKLIQIYSEKISTTTYRITILADRFLQEWIFNGAKETFSFEDSEILRKAREFYHLNVWKTREIHEIKLWFLDMQIFKDILIILSAAVNLNCNSQRARHGIAYLYDEKSVYPVLITNKDISEAERIEFKENEDKILAAVSVQDLALFFSKTQGIISICPLDFDPNEITNNSSVSNDLRLNDSMTSFGEINNFKNISNLSMYEYDPEEIIQTHDDLIHKLKASFLYYVKRNSNDSLSLIENILKEERDLNNIDYAIVSIANEIASDTPAEDPRWKHFCLEKNYALGRSTSMQSIMQLKDKKIAFKHFIDYLHALNLWEKLSTVTQHGITQSTYQLLSDINEQIEAAISLKMIHEKYAKIINDAIDMVLKEKESTFNSNLTNQDMFYVNALNMKNIIYAFVKIIASDTASQGPPNQILSTIIDVDTILLTILSAITKFRTTNAGRFEASSSKMNFFEYVPWTSLSGKNGVYDPLIQLVNLHVQENLKSIGPSDMRKKMFWLLSELVDFILSSKQKHILSITDEEKRKIFNQKYEALRTELISHFVRHENYDIGVKLAEKYLDFQALCQIADQTNDEIRLADYNERFKHHNFAQYAINWHLRQNKHSQIFNRFNYDNVALSKFFDDHPSIAWIQHIKQEQLKKASVILAALAHNEKELVDRKKTLLSIAKLNAIASDSVLEIDIEAINSELSLIKHQEHLPKELLLSFGFDIKSQKVLTPEEIINLYIYDEKDATEDDFRKALELLHLVKNPKECEIKIWCAAILKDDWEDYDPENIIDKIQNMTFFKLIDLCYVLGGSFNIFMPNLKCLMDAPELELLSKNKSFQYLIKYGFEYITNFVFFLCDLKITTNIAVVTQFVMNGFDVNFLYNFAYILATIKKKKSPTDKALENFDDFYGSAFGLRWKNIRLAMLCERKYVSLVNIFGDFEATTEMMKSNGAINIKNIYEDVLTRMNEVNQVVSCVTELKKGIEEKNQNKGNKSFVDKSTLNLKIHNKGIHFDRLIDKQNTGLLYEFTPASKIKGLEDFIFESDHYSYYKKNTDFPLNYKKDTYVNFPPNLNVFTYEKGNTSTYKPPQRGLTGVFSHYLLDGSSLLPVLALDIKPGDKILDSCAAPGGKSLVITQTLYPEFLVCNDLSESRLNRLRYIMNDFIFDFRKKWLENNRILLTQHNAINLTDYELYDKILVDAPCTSDRYALNSNDNNYFKPTRIKERLKLPETQAAILSNCIQLLKPGGTLVYSTCSLSPIQNDGVVHMALSHIFKEKSISVTIHDLSIMIQLFQDIFEFENPSKLRYGQMVLPHIACNFGPIN
uniref:CSON000919 protein n=1 Tax=Culicoides sonorensis TaxID=179676 RepID=A0A336M2M2_CULSO